MTYFEHIARAMTNCGKDEKFRVLGYNVRFGGRGGGSFNGVSDGQLIEMPLAENLMAGAAIGFSLDGFLPLIYVERMDFLTCMMDAVVSHLDKISLLSDGLHKPAAIIRVVVGNKHKPLFTGPTHTQNLTLAMREMVSFPVVDLRWKTSIEGAYESAMESARKGISTMLVEHKDLHSTD